MRDILHLNIGEKEPANDGEMRLTLLFQRRVHELEGRSLTSGAKKSKDSQIIPSAGSRNSLHVSIGSVSERQSGVPSSSFEGGFR